MILNQVIIQENSLATDKEILMAKARQLEVDFFDMSEYELKDYSILALVPESIVRRYCLLPVEKEGGVLSVAMKDPSDIFTIDDLQLATQMDIHPMLSEEAEIWKRIEKYYPAPVKPVKAAESTGKAKRNEDAGKLDEGEGEDSSIFGMKIGDMLVQSGILSEGQLEEALEEQHIQGGRIGEILVRKEFITKKTLFEFLEKQVGIPHLELSELDIPVDVVKTVGENIARRNILIPIEKNEHVLKVAMSDPMNIFSIDDLRLATGLEIIPVLADEEQIKTLLDKHYGRLKEVNRRIEANKKLQDYDKEIEKVKEAIADEISSEQNDPEDILDIHDVENAPIVKMVNIIFNKAVASGASDIHIEPYEDCVIIRYRIDGQLVEVMKHEKNILSALVARIKIISGLNISERRLPQDGRITTRMEEKSFDMRVSVLPMIYGEKIVIRIADKEGFNISKKQLGFMEEDLEKFDEILSHPHGIVLVTGPTGSGKSTTLYTALKELCKPNVNILTVEDPVECTIRGVNQVQVNTKTGLDFSVALRSFLRQDPDIIMVGEIRDAETAEIATRAAITGHLVLSTLHTNDSASSVTRMIDMGIEPYMISSSIAGVIAQRLVRRLCPKCKEAYVPGINERDLLKINEKEAESLYMAKGCPDCNHTGYKGRIAIYEIMTVNREIREMISKNVPSSVLKDAAVKNGMKTLKDSCACLVKAGITSVDEMYKVTYTKNEL